MTKNDITHLCEVCESVQGQIKASEKQSMTMDDFGAFLGRMLWAIHASNGNPRFDEQKFRQKANGENVDIFPPKK